MTYTVQRNIKSGPKSYTYFGKSGGVETAWAALQIEAFVAVSGGWLFRGKRLFAFKTVAKLIEAGKARRVGDICMAVR